MGDHGVAVMHRVSSSPHLRWKTSAFVSEILELSRSSLLTSHTKFRFHATASRLVRFFSFMSSNMGWTFSFEREGDDDAAVNFLTNRGYHIEPYGRWRQEMMLFHPSVELGKPRAQLIGGAGREVGRHGCGPAGLVLDSFGASHPLGFGCLCLATWCPQLSPTIASHEKKGAWQRAKQQAHVLLTPGRSDRSITSQ